MSWSHPMHVAHRPLPTAYRIGTPHTAHRTPSIIPQSPISIPVPSIIPVPLPPPPASVGVGRRMATTRPLTPYPSVPDLCSLLRDGCRLYRDGDGARPAHTNGSPSAPLLRPSSSPFFPACLPYPTFLSSLSTCFHIARRVRRRRREDCFLVFRFVDGLLRHSIPTRALRFYDLAVLLVTCTSTDSSPGRDSEVETLGLRRQTCLD